MSTQSFQNLVLQVLANTPVISAVGTPGTRDEYSVGTQGTREYSVSHSTVGTPGKAIQNDWHPRVID